MPPGIGTYRWMDDPQTANVLGPSRPRAQQPGVQAQEGRADDEKEGGHEREVDEKRSQNGDGGACLCLCVCVSADG